MKVLGGKKVNNKKHLLLYYNIFVSLDKGCFLLCLASIFHIQYLLFMFVLLYNWFQTSNLTLNYNYSIKLNNRKLS